MTKLQQTTRAALRDTKQSIQLLRTQIEDLEDYLAIVEARVRDEKKPLVSQADVLRRFKV